MNLAERVQRTIEVHRLLRRDDRILIAVSGGVDSVALAHLLLRLRSGHRWTLQLGHVDHGLRPESRREAEHVQRLGARWQVPVLVEMVDVAAVHRREGGSLEEVARRLRYDALLRLARACHADAIAVAHTRDDQAETVLMRLVRGAGLAGTAGMPYARPLEERRLVRPLLDCWRQELETCVRAEDLPTVEDPSNHDPRFLRNRIRHQLLPLLEREYNPQIKELLIQWMMVSEAASAYVAGEAARCFRRLARRDGRRVSLALPGLRRQAVAVQQAVLRLALAEAKGDLRQVGFQHWQEVASLLHERPAGSVVDLPGGVRAVKQEGSLAIEPALATVEIVTYNQR